MEPILIEINPKKLPLKVKLSKWYSKLNERIKKTGTCINNNY